MMGATSRAGDEDDLIDRLRERIADPKRRTDVRRSEFSASVSGMTLGELGGAGRSVVADLERLLAHGVDDEISARVDGFERSMSTPADRPLPPPATVDAIVAAEQRMGVRLPPLLRRLYLEVANGGFGPGQGLLGVAGGWVTDHGDTTEDLYDQFRDADLDHPAWTWPAGLVPIVDHGGVFDCVDAMSPEGRIVEWDSGDLDERGSAASWSRSFREASPSLAAWLLEWLAQPTPAQGLAIALDASMYAMPEVPTVPEEARAYWAAMTPEQRASYGLPATGWGRALFGDAWGDDPRDQTDG